METMTLTINISKSVYEILEERAKSFGQTIEQYVVNLLEQHAERISNEQPPKKF